MAAVEAAEGALLTTQAEVTTAQGLHDDALELVNALPDDDEDEDETVKADLLAQLTVVQTAIDNAQDALDLAAAMAAVEAAEGASLITQVDVDAAQVLHDEAWALVDGLPDGVDKEGLLASLAAVQTAINDAQAAFPPTIISHTPSHNAVNIAVASNITITFSEPVVIEKGDIILYPETDFTIEVDANVVTLAPTLVWNDNTTYTVIVTTNVVDVNGVELEDEYYWLFTTETQYSVSLNFRLGELGGWNLISLPVVPTNTNIGAVLGDAANSIKAVWTYDPTNPNAVDGWLVYVPGNPEETNNLTIMTAGYGYWINVTENETISGSGSLLTVGPTPPPSRNLVKGWNLIGYYQIPGEEYSHPLSAFASIFEWGWGPSGITGLWGFNNLTGAFVWVRDDILPGNAFWVSLPGPRVYTPSNFNWWYWDYQD